MAISLGWHTLLVRDRHAQKGLARVYANEMWLNIAYA